ncbi:MAG: hypothetical protein FJ265_14240 [Planctomycetes bacterium]|nr:hypothetical protein [Planctomycetota bacterium]
MNGARAGRGGAAVPRTLHLVGTGLVGREFLARIGDLPLVLVAASDASATVVDRAGLDAAALAAHKARGGRLLELPGALLVPAESAIARVAAGFVVDATPTSAADTAAAVARVRAALRAGAFVALAGKNALAAAAAEWLAGVDRGRVGVNAALGGAGRQLVQGLDDLRARCRALCLVGNVTTTVIVQAIESGASVEQGVAAARARGMLEPDPTLDLDGSDAATKLAAVWGAVFGAPGGPAVDVAAVARQHVRSLDPAVLRARAAAGATTRLVARGSRRGGDLRVAFEELPAGSPLAAPADRVVYGYELPEGLCVHTGFGVGAARTAAALVEDVAAALAGLAGA